MYVFYVRYNPIPIIRRTPVCLIVFIQRSAEGRVASFTAAMSGASTASTGSFNWWARKVCSEEAARALVHSGGLMCHFIEMVVTSVNATD